MKRKETLKKKKPLIEELIQTLTDGQLILVADLPKCGNCSRCFGITQGYGINDMAVWHECEIRRRKVNTTDFCKHYDKAIENNAPIHVDATIEKHFN